MTTDTTQISEDVGYALIETHLGLKKRHDHTVIDSKTGRYTDSARYFGLMDAAYQAGHAAAKAETAEVGEPVAWMTVNDDGDPLMLFFDHIEAMSYCNEGEVPIELFTADQLAAAVAKERDRCASIADSQHFGGDFDDEPMWTTCAARIASAIRAGDAKEPNDA